MSELTQEVLIQHLHYNPTSGVFTRRVATAPSIEVGDVAGCVDSNGYRIIKLLGKSYKAHRLAWLYVHGVWPTEEIDHRNGETEEARLVVLREATRTQNNQNRRRYSNSTSGFKGVSFEKSCGRWRARVQANGTRHTVGFFPTAELASQAYEQAATQSFGNFKRQAA